MISSNNFRSTLKVELEKRMSKNAKYSLRAFARDMKINPARLSEVLNGKKGLSKNAALLICATLHFSKEETAIFCEQVESQCGRSKVKRTEAQERVLQLNQESPKNRTLNLDEFRVISDWHHFAILALMGLPSYQDQPQWVSKQLGISNIQVREAYSRLARLGLIIEKNKKWTYAKKSVFSPDGVSIDATRNIHEALLKKAIEALYTQALDERDFYAYTMPISSQDIPEMKSKIRKFILEMKEEFSNRKKLDQVVVLSNQLFALSLRSTL